jgi:hypothetical protein
MEFFIEELKLFKQDSNRVLGMESTVPERSERKFENKSFNLSSINKGTSLDKSLLIF